MICLAKLLHPSPRTTSFFPSSQADTAAQPSSLHIFNSHHQEPRRRIVLPPIKSLQASKPLLPTRKSLPINPPARKKDGNGISSSSKRRNGHERAKLWALFGVGYWVQGFRCFPWMALNFQLANGLGMSPSALQLVQCSATLPLVAKPLFGVVSDAVSIGGINRVPYISIGVLVQLASWGALALIPVSRETFPVQMAFILLTNVGASLTEVVSDAFLTEFGQAQQSGELQSYSLIAIAAGGILGNLSGGFVLMKTQTPCVMFSSFAALLGLQLALVQSNKEETLLGHRSPKHGFASDSISERLSRQFSEVVALIKEERFMHPLSWVMVSIAVVPVLSGSMFCFQTRFLNIDASIIGFSKVTGQLIVLSATVLYNRYLKRIPMRRLIFGVQILYAVSLLSDLVLVQQVNLKLGIPNEAYVLCLSALAEAVAQFKLLPFTVLFSGLCPPGCEGSLFALLCSALCLSSAAGGFLGVGFASLIGIASDDYSNMPLGIVVQSLASLLPLPWISCLPDVQSLDVRQPRRRRSLER